MMEGLYRLKKGITQYAAEHEEGTYGALVHNAGSLLCSIDRGAFV